LVVCDNDPFFKGCQTQKLRIVFFFFIESLCGDSVQIGDALPEAPKYSVIEILIKKYL